MMRKYYKWIARISGSIFALFWLFIGVVSRFNDPLPMNWESIVMALLIGVSAVGVIIAWFRERLGGALLVIIGIAHSTFALISSGHNHLLAMMISGVPYIIVGVLFLLSSRKPKEKDQESD